MTEVIHIENGYITQHLILSGEPREGDIVVENWKGNVGDSADFYNKDWTKKSDEQLVEEHLIEQDIEIKDESEQDIILDTKAIEQQVIADTAEQKAETATIKTLPEQVLSPYTRTDELMIQLQEIDLASVRSIRAILSRTDTEEDHKTLKALEQQAMNLRKELNTVTADTNK
jgi:hypothetical protein